MPAACRQYQNAPLWKLRQPAMEVPKQPLGSSITRTDRLSGRKQKKHSVAAAVGRWVACSNQQWGVSACSKSRIDGIQTRSTTTATDSPTKTTSAANRPRNRNGKDDDCDGQTDGSGQRVWWLQCSRWKSALSGTCSTWPVTPQKKVSPANPRTCDWENETQSCARVAIRYVRWMSWSAWSTCDKTPLSSLQRKDDTVMDRLTRCQNACGGCPVSAINLEVAAPTRERGNAMA
jgi:hypothetical protein